jgi:hypothetical protein
VRLFNWVSGIEAYAAHTAYQKRFDAMGAGFRNIPQQQLQQIVRSDPELQKLSRHKTKAQVVAALTYISVFGLISYLTK